MTTYRAAFLYLPESINSVGVCLTLPEESTLSDAELIERAVSEGYAGGVIAETPDRDAHQMTEAEYRKALRIDEWSQ